MATKAEKLIPPNISDSGTFDDDSGLRLFRGMISPWDQIKSSRETYKFAVRQSAMFAVNITNAISIIEPDYEKRQTLMSSLWGGEMDFMWGEDDPMGQVAEFEKRFAIPPFIKDGIYRVANYCDKGDEMCLLTGYIWSATNDRMEKEIHVCDYDICGPEVCDLSIGGGQHFCAGLGGVPLNNFDSERRGCGDKYCHVVIETKRKYGEHPNKDGYEWEQWGPPVSGMRRQKDGAEPIKEVDWLTNGEYRAPLGASFTAGEMYKDFAMWPFAYSTTMVQAIREFSDTDEAKARNQRIVETMFDATGKIQFAEWNTRKAARDWMGVPESVEDGRVMGGYISMILQGQSCPWKFTEFSEDRVVIDCDKLNFTLFGQFPEFGPYYAAYFNGMVKTLVNTEWVVKIDEDAPDETLRFIVEKGLYGYRRQKETIDFEEKGE
jgi:hypothetical protein